MFRSRRLSLALSSLVLSYFVLNVAAVAVDIPKPYQNSAISYVSADLNHAASFSSDRATLGAPPGLLAIWPSSPARYFTVQDEIQCVSIGHSGYSIEYAIKRPLKEGDRYSCLGSHFRVIKCFSYCHSATIEVSHRLGGNRPGYLKSYLYADDCLGVLGFSQNGDLTKKIPLDSQWLRGAVGILADKSYPECRPF
ncbi:MAG: hypothetical protein QOJ27_508 [Sphingomonadales bacterium]|nr:hypothetical protein [Sphingomonadales bacterium]